MPADYLNPDAQPSSLDDQLYQSVRRPGNSWRLPGAIPLLRSLGSSVRSSEAAAAADRFRALNVSQMLGSSIVLCFISF